MHHLHQHHGPRVPSLQNQSHGEWDQLFMQNQQQQKEQREQSGGSQDVQHRWPKDAERLRWHWPANEILKTCVLRDNHHHHILLINYSCLRLWSGWVLDLMLTACTWGHDRGERGRWMRHIWWSNQSEEEINCRSSGTTIRSHFLVEWNYYDSAYDQHLVAAGALLISLPVSLCGVFLGGHFIIVSVFLGISGRERQTKPRQTICGWDGRQVHVFRGTRLGLGHSW